MAAAHRGSAFTAPLTEEQVLQYYRAHPDEFIAAEQVLPFRRAQRLACERAEIDQRQRTINQWLRDLRSRADVVVPAR